MSQLWTRDDTAGGVGECTVRNIPASTKGVRGHSVLHCNELEEVLVVRWKAREDVVCEMAPKEEQDHDG